MPTMWEVVGSKGGLCYTVGIVVIAYAALNLVMSIRRGLKTYFLGPALRLNANLRKAGSWAVVTGCTDGIGKAYAQQLAERKLNLVLISRTQQKLDNLARELELEFDIQTRTVAVDFSHTDIYGKIQQAIEGLDISTLVNNVGMPYDHPEFFMDIPENITGAQLNVNMRSVTMMTSMVLPAMKAKGAGFIINISSAAGSSPVPLLVVYSSCKNYVDVFSKGLQKELVGTGVVVQLVKPWIVATKMSVFQRANFFVPSPTTFVRSALNTVGLEAVTSGFWIHAVQEWARAFVPSFLDKPMMMWARASMMAEKREL